MTKADLLLERGAARLHELSRRAAGRGDGIGEWLAEELRDDAEFLRKLKPSLIAARARGEPVATGPSASAAPPPPRPKKPKARKKKGGVSPVVVVGAAFAAGIVLAKVIDWRGHAHPRD